MTHAVDNPLLQAAAYLVSALAQMGIVPTFVGGVAVSLIAKPRYTGDLDALIIFDADNVDTLLNTLARHGFRARFEGMAELARRVRMVSLAHEDTGSIVDICLGYLPFEIEVQERGAQCDVAGASIRIASPEDLVILKAITNRPKDREDIRCIVEIYTNLDRARIRFWVEQFAELLEKPGLRAVIERVLDGGD